MKHSWRPSFGVKADELGFLLIMLGDYGDGIGSGLLPGFQSV